MAGTGGESDTGYGGFGETGVSVPRNGVGGGTGIKKELINLTHKVGSTIVSLYSTSATAAKGVLISPKEVSISNSGGAATAVIMKMSYWTDATTQGTSNYLQFLVGSGETMNIPMSRIISSDTADDVYRGTELAQAAPVSNMYRDSGADTTEGFADDNDTTITFDDGSGGVAHTMFRVGDLIRLDDEICKVREIVDTAGDGAYTPAHLVVDRGVHGTTKADHTNNTNIRLAFFNAYHPFTAATGGYDKVQTDNDGKFKATNFFGYGRATTEAATGILAGSVAIKFYGSGYQELGLSGITAGTNTGLTAGETYYFFVAADGGSAYEVGFTVDASNTNFGGRNGVLSKIQDILNTQYYTAGNLFEKKVTVGIVNGDIRFTSGSYLSTSAIALTAGTSGADTTTEIFAQAIGRFPILAKIEDAVTARLPDNTVPVGGTGQSITNERAFMYDDGFGKLIGAGNGTIDYGSGAVSFTAKPNSEFVVSARYGSVLAGNVNASAFNTIEDISAISTNDKIETKVTMRVSGYSLNGK